MNGTSDAAVIVAIVAVALAASVYLPRLLFRSKLRGNGKLWELSAQSHGSFRPVPSSKQFAEIAPAETLLKLLPALREHPTTLRYSCVTLVVPDLRLSSRSDDPDAEALAERVTLVYGFLSYAYLRSGARGEPELPASLAAPWAAASRFLGRAMSLDYVTTVLLNCSLPSDTSEYDSNTMPPEGVCAATFTGASDEAHFYMLHARIEAAAAPGVRAIIDALDSPMHPSPSPSPSHPSHPSPPPHPLKMTHAHRLTECMVAVAAAVRATARLLPRMHDGCDGDFFYSELRPLLAGFDHPVKVCCRIRQQQQLPY